MNAASTSTHLPRIGVGTWQIDRKDEYNRRALAKVLSAAIDSGVRLFDTAESYGKGAAEQTLGSVLAGKAREDLTVVTKFTHTHSSPRSLRKACEKSLKRLRCSYIDYYLQHYPPCPLEWSETADTLEALKREGKILHYGVSNWGRRLTIADPKPALCQEPYNLLWRNAEVGALKECESEQIPILAYSPLAQGLLSGRSSSEILTVSNQNDARRKNVLYTDSCTEAVRAVVVVLEGLSQRHDVSIASVAIAWLLSRSPLISCILGARTEQHLECLHAGLLLDLTQDELNQLDVPSRCLLTHTSSYPSPWNWEPGYSPLSSS